ncbi:MAG TPA: hypothetical protein VMV29_09830 [Ktedonobacterales bacterium]|nr:hypothetical protein [Ktedonobacterales bacterium]
MEDAWDAMVMAIAGFYTFLGRDLWVTPWRLGRSLRALYQVRYDWDAGVYYAYAPIPWWQELVLWPLLRIADKRPLRRLTTSGHASAELAWYCLSCHMSLRGDRHGATYAAGRYALYQEVALDTLVATVDAPRALPTLPAAASTYGVTMAQAAEGLCLLVKMMNHQAPQNDEGKNGHTS